MDLSDAIQAGTDRAGKNYEFTEGQSPKLPAQHWYQHTTEGLALFVVFYTQACRWSRCLGCNLPSKMSRFHVSYKDIMRQVDYLFSDVVKGEKREEIRKVIISNNGSILDEETFSTTALVYFVAKMNMECPNISTLTIETRPEYVDMGELEILARVLREGDTPTTLELAIGFEAFDDTIRNKHFLKGMTIEVFESLARDVAQHGFKLKTYFMVKPTPQITEDEAINDIVQGIEYLDRVAKKYGVEINMHLNPTYVASGTPLEEAFRNGTFQPPALESVRRVLLEAEGKEISLFVGLYDEGLAVPGGGCVREEDHELAALIEEFNQSQDYALLRPSRR